MDSMVELKNVSRIYRQGNQEVRALDNFSLSVAKGEFLALSGPSGSGKTTTLNLIGALDEPSSGEISLEGRSLKGLSASEKSHLRRDRIGFVFQAYNLIPVLTAFENVEFILALQGKPVPERRKQALDMLAEVGLSGLEKRRPDELSGGQQQRVAIARAMAHQPAVVLADEPTANLDSSNAEALLTLMEKLNRERGLTFIFSTHDARVMERARRVLKLRDGRFESEIRRA
jgi:putative ABC transport system ATP-binding protein